MEAQIYVLDTISVSKTKPLVLKPVHTVPNKPSYKDVMRKSLYKDLYDNNFSKEMNAIAFDIYTKNITKTYRGTTRNEIYRVCLHLAKIGKQPKDIIYIHDVTSNIREFLPRAIRLLIPHVKSRLTEAIRHKRIEKMAYYIAEFSNFKKDTLQCWLEAEKLYDSVNINL